MTTSRPVLHSSSDDASLLHAIGEGDREALATLYDRFAPLMLGLAKRMLGSPREAEDLVQDVFLEAWHRARYYDASRGSVRTWLLMRLRSRALDRKRAAARTERTLLDDDQGRVLATLATEPPAVASLDAVRLHGLVEALPSDQRTVVELAYFEGRTYVEMACELGIPVGTVKSRMARAIVLLRAGLRDTGPRNKLRAES